MPSRQAFTSLCQSLARGRTQGRADLHLHSVHSDGANCESLLKVARAIEYTATVEAVFGKPAAEDAAP